MVLIEKMMVHLIGIHCNSCYVATTRPPRNGRIRTGYIFFVQEATRKDGHFGGTKDSSNLDNVQIGYLYYVGSSLYMHSIIHSELVTKKIRQKEDKQYSLPPWFL